MFRFFFPILIQNTLTYIFTHINTCTRTSTRPYPRPRTHTHALLHTHAHTYVLCRSLKYTSAPRPPERIMYWSTYSFNFYHKSMERAYSNPVDGGDLQAARLRAVAKARRVRRKSESSYVQADSKPVLFSSTNRVPSPPSPHTSIPTVSAIQRPPPVKLLRVQTLTAAPKSPKVYYKLDKHDGHALTLFTLTPMTP